MSADVQQADQTTWGQIGDIKAWIDKSHPLPDRMDALSLRIHKITEEVGEVAQAFVGVTGANPRKGRSHSEEDLSKELCDVILTAQVALATLVDDPGRVFGEHLARVHGRSLGVVHPG